MELPAVEERRGLSRTTKYKIAYVSIVGGGLASLAMASSGVDYGSLPHVLGFAAIALIISHHLVPLFWFDLMVGWQHLFFGRYKESKARIERFLRTLQRWPGLKKLRWLAFNVYSMDPEAQALNALGVAEYSLGEFQLARLHLEAAIMRDPEFPLPYFNRGCVAFCTGPSADADRWMQMAATLGFRNRLIDELWMLSVVCQPNRSFGQRTITSSGDSVVELLNDNETEMVFVIESLEQVFGMTGSQAAETMREVHENGSATIGSFDRDEADAKVDRLLSLAREKGFPLQCRVKQAN